MNPVPSREAVTIRPAGLDDAPAIAAIHVAAWQETYAGLLPPEMIAAQTVERRLAAWTRILGGRNRARRSRSPRGLRVSSASGPAAPSARPSWRRTASTGRSVRSTS